MKHTAGFLALVEEAKSRTRECSADEVYERLTAGASFHFVDVREDDEWRAGRALWHDLVRVLAPDVIILSIARHHLDEIEFEPVDNWRTCYTLQRRNQYAVTVRTVEVLPGQRALLVFGRAAHTPFGTVSKEIRRSIGAEIRRLVDAG